jgi:tetratricopeptide (TPR) repeat protein
MTGLSAAQNYLQTLFGKAVGFHQKGNLAEAERLYLEMIAIAPANFAPRHMLGIIRAQQGQNTEALKLIGSALKINPNAPEILLNYGNVLKALGRLGEALASYDKALAIRPDYAGVWNNRGTVLHTLKRLDDALASFDRALTFKHDYVDGLCNRGNALYDLKRFDEALASYDRALAIKPNDIELLYHRGNTLLELKLYEEALASCDRALEFGPDNIDMLCCRGIALSRLGRFPETLACYDRVLEIQPDHTAALCNRGTALYDLGRYDEALVSIDKALSYDPTYAHAAYSRAKVLCEHNRVAEAFSTFMEHAELVYGSPGNMAPSSEPIPPHKVRHDQEQQEYLANNNVQATSAKANDMLHIEGGARLSTPAINPKNANCDVTEQWQKNQPQIVVIDNLLTDEALAELRRFCLGSKVWRKVYHRGYLGAFPEHGFSCPLLAQIADEFRDTFPAIFGSHPLEYLWAFKYDSQLEGIGIHADEAAVNVNFWITPDDANLDETRGGLVIWDKPAPLDWNFRKFNGDHLASRDYLANSGAKSVTVPYRANRAIIFDSDLFHETDKLNFKDGYVNRRINITLLYGRRGSSG